MKTRLPNGVNWNQGSDKAGKPIQSYSLCSNSPYQAFGLVEGGGKGSSWYATAPKSPKSSHWELLGKFKTKEEAFAAVEACSFKSNSCA